MKVTFLSDCIILAIICNILCKFNPFLRFDYNTKQYFSYSSEIEPFSILFKGLHYFNWIPLPCVWFCKHSNLINLFLRYFNFFCNRTLPLYSCLEMYSWFNYSMSRYNSAIIAKTAKHIRYQTMFHHVNGLRHFLLLTALTIFFSDTCFIFI